MLTFSTKNALTSFYLGTTADHRGRRIEEIWAQSAFWLEHTHDYVQWLFPIPEAGRFNGFAPVLGDEERAAFSQSEELRHRQRISLDVMLGFFGLERDNERILPRDHLNVREHIWLKAGGHNHLRVSRIIRSMYFCSQPSLASTLQEAFTRIGKTRGMVSEQSLAYWQSAIPPQG